jgi:putative Ca2+/H+ antiporter (TMEM165/GDT1 family)
MTAKKMSHHYSRLLPLVVVVLLSCCVVPSLAVDLFESFDQNHDGSISRTEYDEGMLKLSSTVQGPFPSGAGGSSFFSSFLSDASEGNFWNAFSSGVAMILATEIGDKTFFIAAILSMRHARSAVFGGAILALIIMTILSSAMGFVLPAILPKQYTHLLGGVLFLYFGCKLILESRSMEANKVSEELEEVEEELLHPNKKTDADEEMGSKHSSSSQGPAKAPSSGTGTGKAMSTLSWSQIFTQSLTLTFVAEWGDRSQIATIALASHKNPYGVTLGGCIGHSMCTGLAVVGGRMLAARISEKTVSFWGGCIFLVFGIHSMFFES